MSGLVVVSHKTEMNEVKKPKCYQEIATAAPNSEPARNDMEES
jgi:hypothetical protein